MFITYFDKDDFMETRDYLDTDVLECLREYTNDNLDNVDISINIKRHVVHCFSERGHIKINYWNNRKVLDTLAYFGFQIGDNKHDF